MEETVPTDFDTIPMFTNGIGSPVFAEVTKPSKLCERTEKGRKSRKNESINFMHN
jgi:hypothetical protein